MGRVNASAIIGDGTKVGYGATIGPAVQIGRDCEIGPGCVLTGRVIIGDRTILSPGCVIGWPPRQRLQQRVAPPDGAVVRIGSDVVLLEHVVVSQPMVGVTTIEDRAAVGPFSHIAHDNTIGAGAVLTAQCALGGYVRLGPKAMAGIGTRIHQRLVVGALTMTGMGAVVVQHLVPGITVVGVPARLTGVNRVGLRRTGLSDKHIAQWADAMASGVVPADHPMIDELRVFQEYVMASTTTKGVIPPNPWIIR